MLDRFLEVAYEAEKQASNRQQLVDELKRLPVDELKKIASGESKIAYIGDDPCWLDKFKDSPFYQDALALEEQGLELEIVRQQKEMAERQNRDTTWEEQDALRVKKRMLELELRKAEAQAAGAPPEPEMAPPAAPAPEPAPAQPTETPKQAAALRNGPDIVRSVQKAVGGAAKRGKELLTGSRQKELFRKMDATRVKGDRAEGLMENAKRGLQRPSHGDLRDFMKGHSIKSTNAKRQALLSKAHDAEQLKSGITQAAAGAGALGTAGAAAHHVLKKKEAARSPMSPLRASDYYTDPIFEAAYNHRGAAPSPEVLQMMQDQVRGDIGSEIAGQERTLQYSKDHPVLSRLPVSAVMGLMGAAGGAAIGGSGKAALIGGGLGALGGFALAPGARHHAAQLEEMQSASEGLTDPALQYALHNAIGAHQEDRAHSRKLERAQAHGENAAYIQSLGKEASFSAALPYAMGHGLLNPLPSSSYGAAAGGAMTSPGDTNGALKGGLYGAGMGVLKGGFDGIRGGVSDPKELAAIAALHGLGGATGGAHAGYAISRSKEKSKNKEAGVMQDVAASLGKIPGKKIRVGQNDLVELGKRVADKAKPIEVGHRDLIALAKKHVAQSKVAHAIAHMNDTQSFVALPEHEKVAIVGALRAAIPGVKAFAGQAAQGLGTAMKSGNLGQMATSVKNIGTAGLHQGMGWAAKNPGAAAAVGAGALGTAALAGRATA